MRSLAITLIPWITSAGALLQLATVRKRPVFAFTLGLAYQPLWVVFAVLTGAWGFLVATAAFVYVNASNLYVLLRTRRKERALFDMLTADREGRILPGLRAALQNSTFEQAESGATGPPTEYRVGQRQLEAALTEARTQRATGGRVVYSSPVTMTAAELDELRNELPYTEVDRGDCS